MVAVTALGLLGCGEATAPTWSPEGYLAAYGVLLAGSDTASLILQRGLDGSTSWEAVVNAQVGLQDNGETTWLTREDPGLPGCRRLPAYEETQPSGDRDCWVSLLPEALQSGSDYGLRILLPEGDSVRGSVRVPDFPIFHGPPSGQRWSVPFMVEPAGAVMATIPVEVEVGSDARLLEVHASLAGVWGGGEEVPLRFCEALSYAPATSDPGAGSQALDLWFFGAICEDEGQTIPWDSLDLRLTATAYEENYASYLEAMVEGEELSRSAAGFGITGAIGVFGSAALAHRVVRIFIDANPSSAPAG